MIHFVLENNCRKTLYRIFTEAIILVMIAQNNPLRALDISAQIGNRQAPLATKFLLRRTANNLGIEEDLELFAHFVESLDCHHSTQNAHLRSSDSDTLVRRIFYGCEHRLFEHLELCRTSHRSAHPMRRCSKQKRVYPICDAHHRHHPSTMRANEPRLLFGEASATPHKHSRKEYEAYKKSHHAGNFRQR